MAWPIAASNTCSLFPVGGSYKAVSNVSALTAFLAFSARLLKRFDCITGGDAAIGVPSSVLRSGTSIGFAPSLNGLLALADFAASSASA